MVERILANTLNFLMTLKVSLEWSQKHVVVFKFICPNLLKYKKYCLIHPCIQYPTI